MLGVLFGGVAQRHRQRGDQAGARSLAFLGVQVQRVTAFDERVEVKLGAPVGARARGDPAGDVGIAQERQDLARGPENPAALFKRGVDLIEH